jgi:hypothetical protein
MTKMQGAETAQARHGARSSSAVSTFSQILCTETTCLIVAFKRQDPGIRLEEVTRFEEELSTACRNLPKTHIVNVDESMWLLFWQSRKTVGAIGMEAVTIEID